MVGIRRSFLRLGAVFALLIAVAVIRAPGGEDAEAIPAPTEYAFAGAIKTKFNAQAQPVVQENVHVQTDVLGQFKSLTATPDGAPATGTLLLDTSDTGVWKAPAKLNSTTWTVQTKSTSATAAAIFVNGQYRALKAGATLTVKFVGNKSSLYLKLTGTTPTGIGMGTTSVESETTTQNLDSRLYVFYTVPDEGGTVSTEETLYVVFSEPLDGFDPTGTTIVCDSVDVPFDSQQSGSQVSLDPISGLPAGASCVLTVAKDGPSDADLNDPPSGLEQDYVVNFTIDAAPTVDSYTPTVLTNVSTTQDFTFDFSEPVDLAAGAYTYSCTPSGNNGILAVPLSNVTSVTITGAWTQNDTCSITIHASLVTDVDIVDPPDTMEVDVVVGFTVEELAPFVVSTIPANGATGVSTAATTSITFSEPVTLLNGAVWTRYDCGPGFQGDVTWTSASLGPQITFTFPGAPIFAGKTCTNTIYTAGFADADSVDPPNFMVADYVWTFTYAP